MSSSLMKIIMTWNLKNKDEKYIAKLLLKLFDRLPTMEQKLEILYALSDFEPKKLEKILPLIRPIVIYMLRNITFSRLRVLLLFYARKCPECLRVFLIQFKNEISSKIETLHFNDAIVFVMDLARIDEPSGLFFVKFFGQSIKKLAKSEGFTHFGTIIWHMLMMKHKNLAKSIFDNLFDIISRKARYLSDIYGMVYLVYRLDPEFAYYILDTLRPRINELLNSAKEPEKKNFLASLSKFINPNKNSFTEKQNNSDNIELLGKN